MARKSNLKLTPARQQRIVDAIKAGNYIDTSATAAGISRSTFYGWMERGQEADAPKAYRDFRAAVEDAQAAAELRYVSLIEKAAEEQWTAAAWWLERKMPAKWGRHERRILEHTGPGGGPVQVEDVRAKLTETVDELAARRERRHDTQPGAAAR